MERFASPVAPNPVGRRQESRLRIRLASAVVTLDGNCRTVLADLSRNGARIEHPDFAFRVGSEAVLQWGQHEAFGQIVWVEGNTAGIRFYDPVDPALIARTRRLDEVARLPDEQEQLRQNARAFVNGHRL